MIQSAKHRGVLGAEMRSLMAQHSKRREIGDLCTTKREVVTSGADTTGLRKINRPGQFVSAQKSEEKHCFCLIPRLNEPEQPATKGGGWIEISENDHGRGRSGHRFGAWSLCATQGDCRSTSNHGEIARLRIPQLGYFAQKAQTFPVKRNSHDSKFVGRM